jgi:hypothetical protein
MPEEADNPFMVVPKKKEELSQKVESFGNLEEVSFMASPEELKRRPVMDVDIGKKPHWEDAGTPIWEKKKGPDDVETEVIDHNS